MGLEVVTGEGIGLGEPFWIWAFLAGDDNDKWELAYLKEDDAPDPEFPDRKKIVLPLADGFEDYWYPDEAVDRMVVKLPVPARP